MSLLRAFFPSRIFGTSRTPGTSVPPGTSHSGTSNTRRIFSATALLAICLVPLSISISVPSSANAIEPCSTCKPWIRLTSRTIPTHIAPEGEGTIVVQATNLGNAETAGRFTFADNLPPGLKLEEVQFSAPNPLGPNVNLALSFFEICETTASSVACKSDGGIPLNPVLPYESLELRLKVKDEGAEPGAINETQFNGGGAQSRTLKRPVAISSAPAGFGVGEFSLQPEEEGGEPDTHAGTHPYQLTNTLSFNRDSTEALRLPALPRNLEFKLAPGQVGNATALPQCDDQDFALVKSGGSANSCPTNTAIGVAVVTVALKPSTGETVFVVPIFNLTPATGEPARFGFEVISNPVILDTKVRSGPGEDYGVTVSTKNTTQLASFISATATFWGAPRDPSHNASRGWGCLLGGFYQSESGQECEPSNDAHPAAFLTLPTNCNAPFQTTLEGNSWPTKAAPSGLTLPPVTSSLADSSGNPLALTGCNQLSFAPSIEATPTSQSASSPSGLDFNLNFHDEGLTNATGTAQSELKDTTVTLPEGLTINPSAGVGLEGCSPAGYAAESLESPPGAGCPNASKLGTVEITTPLLSAAVHGSIFIATPYDNPFSEPGHPNGSLVSLYIVAKNPENGILIKLAGRVDRNPSTGRLTTSFLNNPQLPFDHFNFHFREGQQAPLITPQLCGTYSTQALLSPWAEPLSTLTDTSPFQITSGAGGSACPSGGAPPFTPQIESGMVNNVAGAFSPFVLHLSRGDADQEISGFSTSLPPGLTGDLTGVPFCPEENIAAARHKTGAEEESSPSCPAASQVGHTLVGTGVGAVLAYVPGQVYLAGPYNGTSACTTGTPGCAPFSIVSVTSAKVGPFDLGTVVLRFGLNIDPYTAQVSVSPSTSEPIPTIIDGIVTHVRDIRVTIERPGNAPFTLNPTSCNKLEIGSTLTSDLGASSTVASPFQTASCQSLKFEPKVAIATSGKTSKAEGASLTYTVSYPNVPIGTDANIKYVKVELPKQLPSRLTTLQKACTAPVFAANPASCPAASIIGHAKAVVPNIPVPLEGPVYFVSNGGEAFPNLVMVLQGYGVTIDLVGDTLIKNGVTSTTFKTVPDNPLTSFEINLPEGPYSALAANGNLCKPTVTKTVKKKVKVKVHGRTETMTRKLKEQVSTTLTMPNEYIAQNGATYNYNAKLSVTGCPPARAKAKPGKKAKAKKKAKARRSGRRK